jgi:HPt (histidine-containing phosphotransfer) domain-containing protein
MPLDANAAVWAVPEALQQLADGGDGELVEELIAMFQTDTASRLQVMQQAVGIQDFATVSAEAHTIKGSSLQMGADQLAELCRQMEQESRKAMPADLTLPLGRMMSCFDEVCRVIAVRNFV